MSTVADAITAIRAGEIVCFPTESSYGLAVDPRNSQALASLAELKGRDERAPFALIAGDIEQAQACTGAWSEPARLLATAHWPGPLTLILPPGANIGARCVGPSGGVGVRISSLADARQLALGLGFAITATSANPSGQPAARSAKEATAYFGAKVAVYLDGGPCTGLPSTLVDFDAEGRPQVLRQGPIILPAEELD